MKPGNFFDLPSLQKVTKVCLFLKIIFGNKNLAIKMGAQTIKCGMNNLTTNIPKILS